jgi:hypothetical protein
MFDDQRQNKLAKGNSIDKESDPIDRSINRLRENLLELSPSLQRSEHVRRAVEWCMDPAVEREVKTATHTVKAMVKSQLYLEMFYRGYSRMKAARRYVELFNKKRKVELI